MEDFGFAPLSNFAYERSEEEMLRGVRYGIESLDEILGPLQRGLLHLIVGYAHSGKTLLLLTMLYNNPDKAVVLFTPDETVELVLQKLVQVLTGLPQHQVPAMGKDRMRSVIEREVPNLAICDRILTIPQMGVYLDQYEAHYRKYPDLVVYDYLELLPDGGEPKVQANLLKHAAKATQLPWLVLHQTSRGAGGPGQPLTLRSMSYGGEQQAHTVVGVWRQGQDPDLDAVARAQEAKNPTVNISVLKNKQRPKTTDSFGFQLVIDPDTGLIRPAGRNDRIYGSIMELRDEERDPSEDD